MHHNSRVDRLSHCLLFPVLSELLYYFGRNADITVTSIDILQGKRFGATNSNLFYSLQKQTLTFPSKDAFVFPQFYKSFHKLAMGVSF